MRYLIVVLLVLGLGQYVNAAVAALHQDANDPEDEGWTIRDVVSTYPVTNDMGSGVAAWAVDDNSTNTEGGYRIPLTPQEVEDAIAMGWRLSARLRVVAMGEDLDFTAAQVLVGNGASLTFGMGFNVENDGSPLVNVGSEIEPAIVDLDDLDSGYHLYDLVFDPNTFEAELFVDGDLRASNIGPFDSYGGPWETSVNFGSTFTGGTGHANYNLVKYEIIPEPDSFLLALLALTLTAAVRLR